MFYMLYKLLDIYTFIYVYTYTYMAAFSVPKVYI